MPVHHEEILTKLNVDRKVKDKKYYYHMRKYELVLSWIFLSTMQSRNNHVFTWWANIPTADRWGAKNDSSASFSEAVFFSCATIHNNLIRNTAQHRDDESTQAWYTWINVYDLLSCGCKFGLKTDQFSFTLTRSTFICEWSSYVGIRTINHVSFENIKENQQLVLKR